MKSMLVAIGLAMVSLLSVPAVGNQADTIQIARYTEISLEPTREVINPLDVVIDVQLPRRMNLVGESIEYLLSRSGYQIRKPSSVTTPEMYVLFSLPIPAQHRAMGTLRLRKALEVLAGDAYEMRVNKVTREIWFALDEEGKELLPEIDVNFYKERWEKRMVARDGIDIVVEPAMPSETQVAGTAIKLAQSASNSSTKYGPVLAGQTLGGIAKQHDFPEFSTSQVMVSIFLANKESFINGNMNLLKKDTVLVIPTRREIAIQEDGTAQAFEQQQYREYIARKES